MHRLITGLLQNIDLSIRDSQALILSKTREKASQVTKVVCALGDYLGVTSMVRRQPRAAVESLGRSREVGRGWRGAHGSFAGWVRCERCRPRLSVVTVATWPSARAAQA